MWKDIRLDSNLYEGINSEKQHFREIIIRGLNDLSVFWKIEELVTVIGTLIGKEIVFKIAYKKESIEGNEQLKQFIQEAKKIISEELLKYYNDGEKTSFFVETENLSIKVTGRSKIPFWNHDLKIEAAIALLETVDFKDFAESNEAELYFNKMEELQELLNSIRT